MQMLERHGAVVVFRCPVRFSAESIRTFTADFDEVCSAGQRFAALVDTTSVSELPGPAERKLLAAWMNDPKVQAKQKALNVGSATVIDSSALRAMMTALYWLWTPPTPQHPARDLVDGLDWCLARLAAANVPSEMPIATLRSRVVRAPR